MVPKGLEETECRMVGAPQLRWCCCMPEHAHQQDLGLSSLRLLNKMLEVGPEIGFSWF